MFFNIGSVSSADATPTITRTQRRTRASAVGRGGGRRRGRGRGRGGRSGSARETGTEDDQDQEEAADDGDDGEDAQAVEEAGTPVGGTSGTDVAESMSLFRFCYSSMILKADHLKLIWIVTQHKVKGVLYDVINDEIEMEEDPRGEMKVDANGRLLGGMSSTLRFLIHVY